MIQKTKSKKVSKNKHNSGGGSNWNYQKTPQDDWDYDGVHETIKADRNQGAGSRAEAGKSVGIGTPESACPPGQTNKLKKYAGTCMPIELGNMRESTNPKEKTSACPPGQSDKLRKYVGICMPISAARD